MMFIQLLRLTDQSHPQLLALLGNFPLTSGHHLYPFALSFQFGKFYFHVSDDIFSCYFGNYLYKINLTNQLNLLSFSDEDHDNNHLNNILKNLKNVFEDISIKKVCFDAKLIIHLCINEYIDFRIFDDISLLAYTLHTGKQKINFETLSNIYNLNYNHHTNRLFLGILSFCQK